MSMVFDIFLYDFTCHFVSNGSDKISIFPKFSTPKFFLDLWMSQKDLFCTHAFENSHHLTNRIFGWYRCKYMYMIFCYFHLFYFTISCFQYLFKELLYDISQLFFQRPLHNRVKIAIFCHVWNNNLANSSTMTLGSTILNQEVHENGGEIVILGCQKSR